MLRSLSFDLALVVAMVGLFKWFIEPLIGYPWMHVVAVLFAVIWVAVATDGARLARRLPRLLRRFTGRR